MMPTSYRRVLFSVSLAIALGAEAAACDESGAVKEAAPAKDGGAAPGDAGGPGTEAGADGGPSDCFINPQTHDEIINACTDAVKLAKLPSLPLQYPDGGLPPLP